jgi:hypothetical protein
MNVACRRIYVIDLYVAVLGARAAGDEPLLPPAQLRDCGQEGFEAS